MYSERFANYHANKEFINCQNPAIMDVNLSKKKVAGFLGQSYVLIPRKVLEMLFHGKGRDRLHDQRNHKHNDSNQFFVHRVNLLK